MALDLGYHRYDTHFGFLSNWLSEDSITLKKLAVCVTMTMPDVLRNHKRNSWVHGVLAQLERCYIRDDCDPMGWKEGVFDEIKENLE